MLPQPIAWTSAYRDQITSVLKQYSTPLFVINTSVAVKQYEKLVCAFRTHTIPAHIAYSYKTNSTDAIVAKLHQHGAWIEVVSGHEYAAVKRLGFSGSEIIFNGPVKRDEDMERARLDGALIHIDNTEELRRLLHLATKKGRRIRVGIRVKTRAAYVPQSRFGFSLQDESAREAVKRLIAARGVSFESLHMHVGTDIDNVKSYQTGVRDILQFFDSIQPMTKTPIRWIDIGGGFPSADIKPFSRRGWSPQPIEAYVSAIASELKSSTFPAPAIICEPGRYLVDESVIFVNRVHHVFVAHNMQRVLIDGAISMLPLVYYRPQIVRLYDKTLRKKRTKPWKTIIAGSTCREDDVLYSGVFPAAALGDYVIFHCVGAYNQSMGSDFIFGPAGCAALP